MIPGSRSICIVLAIAVLLGGAVPLAAQDQPVVFVHGLLSSGGAWAATAERLQRELAITSHYPDLPWDRPFAEQASSLNQRPEFGSMPANAIAIGHSNGGIVAREWSRIHPVRGLVTLGSPNGGAPLVPQFYNWMVFQGVASSYIQTVGRAFSRWSEFSWVMANVHGALAWTADFSFWSVFYLATTLGLDWQFPVTKDMRPGSDAFLSLNSQANLERERLSVPMRVGIVSAAHNFYWAGPARAVMPDYADAVAVALYSTASALMGWGTYIFTSAEAMDFAAIEQASSLFDLAGFLLSIDPTYCMFVSSFAFAQCAANDGVVPYFSQEYPGGLNVYLGFEHNDGPAHIHEMREVDVLNDVLVHLMQVPRRTTPGPPSPPTPEPNPEPTPEPPPPGPEEPSLPPSESGPGQEWLAPGEELHGGQSLWSADRRYEFAYQGDGNLVLYDESGTPLWSSGTAGTEPWAAAMQGDGNFVIYDASGTPIWWTGDTLGHEGAYLVVQNDGNVVIYAPDGTPLWSTGTAR